MSESTSADATGATNADPAPPSQPAGAPATPQAPIVAQGLAKYYGNFAAVQDVSFQVQAGSVTAFLGPNGAGKSTTMRMLTGYLGPSAGRAFLAGIDVSQDRLAASRHLGYLPENGPLYHDMTPNTFLRFIGATRTLPAETLRAGLERVVERCRLTEVWHKPIRKLSKGFRQRVGLAAAILHDPDVLILDEPTAGLDPNQIELTRELIRDLAAKKTVLLSTHILREVEAMADHILLINRGKLVFTGTPKDLAGDDGLEARFRALTEGVAA